MGPLGGAENDWIVDVVEYTDPFCSWAWGTEPKLRLLRVLLGAEVRWRQVIGVLLDGEPEHRDPDALVAEQFARWDSVAAHTGSPLPARLERPAASSRVAARAVKAAELQGLEAGSRVLRRLRESLFIFGRPADEEASILAALRGVPGLDLDALRGDLDTPAVHDAARADWEETRNPLADVIGLEQPAPHPGGAAPDGDRLRYRFPTVVVTGFAGTAVVPGWRPLASYLEAVAKVAPGPVFDPAPPLGPDEALERFETLTEVDLEVLTGARDAPPHGTRLLLRGGPVWLAPSRLQTRIPSRLVVR